MKTITTIHERSVTVSKRGVQQVTIKRGVQKLTSYLGGECNSLLSRRGVQQLLREECKRLLCRRGMQQVTKRGVQHITL